MDRFIKRNVDRFIRRNNVGRYCRLLETATDEDQKAHNRQAARRRAAEANGRWR